MPTTISALANETLCEIIQHHVGSLSFDDRSMQGIPTLRLVSRHWNETIERLPMLWTSVLITEKSAHASGQLPFQSTRLRLFRSLELPLTIHINLDISPEQNSFTESDGMILSEIIHTLAPRVASIVLRANPHSQTIQTAILSSLNNTHMPLLRKFKHIDPKAQVDFSVRGGYLHNPSSILQHQGIPNTRQLISEWAKDLYPSLTEIYLAGVSYNLEQLPIMHGLRRLHIEAQPLRKRPTVSRMLKVLYPARDTLECLQLEDVIKRTPTDNIPLRNPIIFSKLRVLSFGYYSARIASMFFLSVRAPALRSLTLTFTSEPPTQVDRHMCLVACLIEHFPLPQIKTLVLVNVVFALPGDWDVTVYGPDPPKERSEAELAEQSEFFTSTGFKLVSGRWVIPVFMRFLRTLTSLMYLRIDERIGLKKAMSAHWARWTLYRLETLVLDGSPEGLFELAQVVEDTRKEWDWPSPLRMSIGETLKGEISKEEEAKLYDHFTVFSKP